MDTINLTCNVSGFSFSSIQTQWILPVPIPNDRIDINTITDDIHGHIISTLTIKSFQLSDAGLYRCTASLEGLSGSTLYNLTAGMYVYTGIYVILFTQTHTVSCEP